MSDTKRISIPPIFHKLDKGLPTLPRGYLLDGGPIPEDVVRTMHDACDYYFHKQESLDGSEWKELQSRFHADFVEVLKKKDVAQTSEWLLNLHSQNLLRGIDQFGTERQKIEQSDQEQVNRSLSYRDLLVRLAEAVGALNVEIVSYTGESVNIYMNVDEIVERIQDRVGIDISPPKIGAGRFGLQLKNGAVFTNRDIYAIYLAWRIWNCVDHNPDARVCEIGGGMGRLGYFCRKFGIRHYTFFDLPQIALVQFYFNSRALDEKVHLHTPDTPAGYDGVRVFPSWHFGDDPTRYDLIVNTDSMPEMGAPIADAYINRFESKTRRFLSANQESRKIDSQGNAHAIVHEIARQKPFLRLLSRHPFWVRNYYVEELYEVVP